MALLAAAPAVVLTWWLLSAGDPAESEPSQEGDQSDVRPFEVSKEPQEGAPAADRPVRIALDGPAGQVDNASWWGQIIDKQSGLPIRAVVRIGDVAQQVPPATGAFHIVAPSGRGVMLEVDAEGFQGLRRPLEGEIPGDLGKILMEPVSTVQVTVITPGGAIVPEASIQSLGPGDPILKAPSVRRTLGKTDAHGLAEVKLAAACYLIATQGMRCSSIHRWTGQSSLDIVLPEQPPQTIGMRDHQGGEPIPLVRLRLVYLDSVPPVSLRIETGDRGLSSEPIPPGRFRLEQRDQRIRSLTGDGVGAALETGGDPGGAVSLAGDVQPTARTASVDALEVEITRAVGALWVGAELWAYTTIEARDARTGTRIQDAQWNSEYWMPEYASWFRNHFDHPVRAGRIDLPSQVPAGILQYPLGRIREFGTPWRERRLRVWAPGYLPATIDDPLRFLEGIGEHTVFLEPAASRSLKLTWQGDSFPAGELVVSEDNGVEHYVGPLPANGLIGPFGWCGGDVEVRAHSRLVCAISGDQFKHHELVEVLVDSGGRICVEVPAAVATEIWCVNAAGGRESGRSEKGRFVFDHLPVGTYVVGPMDLVRRNALESLFGDISPLQVDIVRDGQELVLEWDPSWGAVRTVDGSITVVGGRADEFVVAPVFGPSDMEFSRWTTRVFPVRADGSYTLSGLTAPPEGVVVADAREKGALRLVGASRDARRVDVRLGGLILEWSTDSADPGRMTAPLEVVLQRLEGNEWGPYAPVKRTVATNETTIEALPEGMYSVHARCNEYTHQGRVYVVAGKVVRMQLMP